MTSFSRTVAMRVDDGALLRSCLGAVLLALALSFCPTPPAASAADDPLDVWATTTYTVVPERGKVSVDMDVIATNRAPDTRRGNVITRWYFDRISFGIPAETTRIAATQSGTKLRIATKAHEGYDEITVLLRPSIFYRQTARVRLTYDLPGGAPRSESDIRVGRAFAIFYAWANGDVGAVRIVLPAGFEYTTSGSTVKESHGPGGSTVLSAAGISDVSEWYVWVTAERAEALTKDRLTIPTGEAVVVRGWPEDAAWGTEVSDVLTRGLPVLRELVGLEWPVKGDLEVTEVHTPLLEGYSGIYDAESDTIRIGEDLDDFTIIHEALHAWFNDDLFGERWINEGLADSYAARALAKLGLGTERPDPVSRSDAAAFLLQTWPEPGRIIEEADQAREDYGYTASWTLMDTIIRDVGLEQMSEVLRAARDGEIAYVGDGAPEKLATPADWRLLLDLLEERGGAEVADDLLIEWVLGPGSSARLSERDEARRAYAALVEQADGWLPPYLIRRPMATWTFELATKQIVAATAVLELRDRVAADAAALGLEPPEGMEAAYETAEEDLSAATGIAEAQQAALDDLEEAAAAVADPQEPLTQLGLMWGIEPEMLLADAKADFEADRLDESRSGADATVALIEDAERIGVERVAIGAGATIAVLAFGGAALLLLRRRRRGMALAHAAVAAPGDIGEPAEVVDAPVAEANAEPELTVGRVADAGGPTPLDGSDQTTPPMPGIPPGGQAPPG